MKAAKLIAAACLWWLFACQSPAVDTNQVINYGTGLASCEEQEATFDGGPEASLQFYVECKHRLGVDAGGL